MTDPVIRRPHRGLAAARKQREGRMPDLRVLSSRHDGSRPQRAGVVPPRPEAIALLRAMENESRLRRVGRVHRLSERDEGLGLVTRETAQKPDDEGEIRGVQRKCVVFGAALMRDRRFTWGILWNFTPLASTSRGRVIVWGSHPILHASAAYVRLQPAFGCGCVTAATADAAIRCRAAAIADPATCSIARSNRTLCPEASGTTRPCDSSYDRGFG